MSDQTSPEQTNYIKQLENLTDRQLMEKQTYFMWRNKMETERIRINVVFFFWIALLGLLSSLYWTFKVIN